jgi:(S)-citramalyl-CoA lyase
MNTRAERVRSALFVPGSRPERIDKAFATGADRIVVDLEDSVEDSLKAQARRNLAQYLDLNPAARVVVRINAVGHSEHQADLDYCKNARGVMAVMLPKAESEAQIQLVACCRKPIWPLIESAKGVLAISSIAQASNVERLTFGALDLGLDLGLKPGTPSANKLMDEVRHGLLFESVSRGLSKPIDTVFPDIADLEGLAKMAANGSDLGFGGMLCIHPTQIQTANQLYSPTQAELDWAIRVIEASRCTRDGAFRLEGRMVDAPVIKQAYQLVANHVVD